MARSFPDTGHHSRNGSPIVHLRMGLTIRCPIDNHHRQRATIRIQVVGFPDDTAWHETNPHNCLPSHRQWDGREIPPPTQGLDQVSRHCALDRGVTTRVAGHPHNAQNRHQLHRSRIGLRIKPPNTRRVCHEFANHR